jgi:peptidoglycan/xylan/chitin deacetylase (PgdA/CDA1 family)
MSTAGDILTPTVSRQILNQGYTFTYPHDKSWALVLTHDVDDITVLTHHLYLALLSFPQNHDLPGIYQLLKGRVNPRYSPYNNFKEILAIEQAYDATSTFFFLPNPDDVFGRKYSLSEIADILGYLQDNGCEIGFHTDYYHYNDIEYLKEEKHDMETAIARPLIGARNHCLRFQTPRTWEVLSDAGFQYDSTHGYVDMIGFRNGLCHPYVPFNRETNKPIDIVELPLNIMDWTIAVIMKQDPDHAWTLIKNLLDTTRNHQGVLNILWHNWTFSFPTSIGTIFTKHWTTLYKKILAYAAENNAWITNCKDLFTHSQKHEYINPP